MLCSLCYISLHQLDAVWLHGLDQGQALQDATQHGDAEISDLCRKVGRLSKIVEGSLVRGVAAFGEEIGLEQSECVYPMIMTKSIRLSVSVIETRFDIVAHNVASDTKVSNAFIPALRFRRKPIVTRR